MAQYRGSFFDIFIRDTRTKIKEIVKLISGAYEGHIRSYNAHELKRVGTAKNLRRVLSWRKGVAVLDAEVDGSECK